MKNHQSAFALGLLPLLLAASPALAQSRQPGSFSEVIDVRVVNLEVVVTDKDGVRVHGLGPEDFRLTIDGHEAPIEYFTEVWGGSAVEQADEAATATLPALAPGEPVGTSYLLFIDEFFSLPVDRNRVLDHVAEQLELLGPRDRMAVVAFDGRQLDMLTTWSQDAAALRRTLDAARERPAFGLHRRAEQRSFEATRALRGARLQGGFLAGLDSQLDIEEQQRAEQLAGQVERVVLAAAAALRGFANPPGRKVMLLLSGGWAYNPAQWVVGSFTRPILAGQMLRGEELFRPLVETANRLSYSLYPVDLPGLAASGGGAEESGELASLVGRELSIEREQDEETALMVLADQTGGRAMIDGASVAAFDRAVDDTRSYYWLGFTPSWKGDDTSHRVKVEMRDRRLEARARGSFSDLSRSREVSMMVESALIFGNPPSDAAPLVVTVGRATRAGFGKVTVPLTVKIPVDALTFLPEAEGLVARTELRIAVVDEGGNSSEIPVIPLAIGARRGPEEGDVTTYETRLKMRRRKHRMVVSLYDTASGKILSTRVEVDPR